MTALPPPPVPPECTMAGNDWFPLHFVRLRKSKWWRRASDLARARNVMLWGWAYEAVPAGSLPDDDDELADAAGFGMDGIDAFIAVKAEIMAPWTLCSDGRWYHPTLVEVVLDSWARTSEKRKKQAEKKRAQRNAARGVPTENANVSTEIERVPRDTGEVAGDTCENVRDNATHAGATKTRQDKTVTPQPPLGGEREFAEALNAYPEAGRVSTTPDKAKSAWDVACRTETPERLLQAVRAFAASTTAQADRANRIPSFQRWLTDKRFAVLLTGSATPTWAGPPEIRAAIAQALGEPFARSYIDPAGWQDVPIRGLVPRNATSAGRIADQALGILETFEASILPVETGRAA